MMKVAPQFEVSYHHPLWEHVWRRLTVRLSTWDLGWDISLHDLKFARYLESKFRAWFAERTYYRLEQTQRVQRAADWDVNSRTP